MSEDPEILINQITRIGLNDETDSPSVVQVDRAIGGVMYFLEYEPDDDGYITKPPYEYMGTFADVLKAALDCVTYELTIEGLSRDEAVELLLSPNYRDKTLELIENCEPWGGLTINGTRFALEDGHLVNEDFGAWPFEDLND